MYIKSHEISNFFSSICGSKYFLNFYACISLFCNISQFFLISCNRQVVYHLYKQIKFPYRIQSMMTFFLQFFYIICNLINSFFLLFSVFCGCLFIFLPLCLSSLFFLLAIIVTQINLDKQCNCNLQNIKDKPV